LIVIMLADDPRNLIVFINLSLCVALLSSAGTGLSERPPDCRA